MPSLRLLAVHADTMPVDRHGVARLIADLHPDVAIVHGAPSLLRWRSACAALAREAGLVVVAGGRTGGGNLLLSGLGVDVEATREFAFGGRRGPRPPGAVLAALRLLGAPFVLGGARLVGSPTERSGRSAELAAGLAEVSLQRPPAVVSVAGLRPGSAAAEALAAGRTALPAGVFVGAGIAVADADEIDGGVRADLTLPMADVASPGR